MSYTKTYRVVQDEKEILKVTVTFDPSILYQDIIWDSKTGLVTAKVDGKRVVLPHTGKSCGTIAPGTFETEGLSPNDMNYHYWYY